jgi:hypothetical protein
LAEPTVPRKIVVKYLEWAAFPAYLENIGEVMEELQALTVESNRAVKTIKLGNKNFELPDETQALVELCDDKCGRSADSINDLVDIYKVEVKPFPEEDYHDNLSFITEKTKWRYAMKKFGVNEDIRLTASIKDAMEEIAYHHNLVTT